MKKNKSTIYFYQFYINKFLYCWSKKLMKKYLMKQQYNKLFERTMTISLNHNKNNKIYFLKK